VTAPEAIRRAFLAAAGALLASAAAAQDACTPDTLDLRDGDDRLQFRVEVVDDEAERSRGLMHRESLPRFAGMLFVYDSPQPVAFWMRNTLIPLDMLFFDGAGRLTRIKENAVPHDETPIVGGDAIRYVLEINGGMAAELGIEPGAEIRHPALEQAAAGWPC
jgi:uncharacterized membrane protein (UPF0127 family)